MSLKLIQIFHLLVVLYMFVCLFYAIYCHVRNRHTFLLSVAYLSVLVESIVFLAFGRTCPLRLLVDRQFATDTADIILPQILSAHITEAGTFLLAIAVLTKLHQTARGLGAKQS